LSDAPTWSSRNFTGTAKCFQWLATPFSSAPQKSV
jgi:hypothetical protein